ncbi:oligosaccharide flippase family protein [Flavobacteriaceae bacterium S0862]|nr:oligosaccharide flippase family protein [Flavobacteriaceae bacterium S0862]
MLKKVKNYKKYFFYALSIVISRGLEYFVLFYAALFLTKEDYGQLEFYKKLIELLAVALAFGLPSLLLTYTKSRDSKVYLNVLAILFIAFLAVIVSPILWALNYQFLIIPILFHAIFFNNGVMPVFFITQLGSNKASIYKSATSFLFYTGVFLLLLLHPEPEKAFVTVNYYLIGLGIVFLTGLFKKYHIKLVFLKRYFGLFKKLLLSSLTLVVSNFANIMFLYTDIMILKLISKTPNTDIADYSFALNIANMLILVPFTMVQVDIEEIKTLKNAKPKAVKILRFISIFSVIILLGYLFLINTFYMSFNETIYIFLVILAAKFFQTQSVLHGTLLLIKKEFKLNLKINLMMLMLNVVLSYVLFIYLNVTGIAIASFITLTFRYFILRYFSKYSAV